MKKIFFKTSSLGCRVNQAEIENISQDLLRHGFSYSNNLIVQSPNLLIINTCVVTQKAEKETRKEIRKLKRLYPSAKLIVLGCAVDAKNNFSSQLPEVDLCIANKDKEKAANLILKHFKLHQSSNISTYQSNNIPTSKYQKSGKKLIKIQDGCNYQCSYCIVPSLRGKSFSIPVNNIINQINNLTEIEEVILTGINLSLYGLDLKPRTSLLELLSKILEETKIAKISFTSLDPQLVNRKLVDLYIRNKRLSRNLHFSIQSGSPTVLKRMNRNPNLKDFTKHLRELKNNDPKFIYSADIIVGFPDESENEFQETVSALGRSAHGGQLITKVHLFRFSPRPGTIAYNKIKSGQWKDLPLEVKRQRERIIDSFLPGD